MTTLVGTKSALDLRLGRWQDVLAGVECDALIFDAPYGERTHTGHNSGRGRFDQSMKRDIDYSHLTAPCVAEIVDSWAPRVRGWFCTITSHDLVPLWEASLSMAGRYVFAPVPILDRGSRVRLQGDGPSCWCVWMIVARPRSKAFAKWGTLPGVYERSPGDERSGRMGGKPLGVMRAIVRDYSRPGDLVCDPFAGHATTLLAAAMEGRRAVGAEVDSDAFSQARVRLGQGHTVDMWSSWRP